MQCVAAGAVPRAVVDVERSAKVARPSAENAPRGNDVSGGIAGANAAEVDDRAKAAAVHEQVGPQQNPCGSTPACRPRPVLRARSPKRQRRQRRRPRFATTRSPRASSRRARGAACARPAVALGSIRAIRARTAPDQRRPGVHRGRGHRDKGGHQSSGRSPTRRDTGSQGGPARPARGHAAKDGSELRQPVHSFSEILGPRRHARQPRAEVVAKPVDGVHRPGRPNGADRQVGELGELYSHQPLDKLHVDSDLPTCIFSRAPELAVWCRDIRILRVSCDLRWPHPMRTDIVPRAARTVLPHAPADCLTKP